MSWNGAGVFNRIYSWVADKNAAIDITASRMDTDTNDITSNGFANTLTRDGQGSASANLPMNSFRHTGVGNGVARTDYAALGQLEDGSVNWGVDSGAADALAVSYAPAITTLVDGQLCFVRAAHANATTTPTFSPNGLTPRTITAAGGAAVSAGDIPAALAEIILRYNLANTRWELLNPAFPVLPASTLVGNATGGAASATAITLGAGLAFNGAALSIAVVAPPQGRLTLTSLTPVLATDAAAQSTVFYTPYVGNTLPIYNGSSFAVTAFAELSMVMSGANFASGAIYDLFVINDAGTIRLGIGPVWGTLTPGSGARGTGAGTTELQRLNGIWTNKNTMTLRYAAGSTVSVAVNQATYVGTMFMDGTNSQVSCHVSYGQSRKWGVWNAYNRVPIIVKAGDTSGGTTVSTTLGALLGNAANILTTLCGLPEEWIEIDQRLVATNSTSGTHTVGAGWNSTTVASGLIGISQVPSASGSLTSVAAYSVSPIIGINNSTFLFKTNAGTVTVAAGELANLMAARWRG